MVVYPVPMEPNGLVHLSPRLSVARAGRDGRGYPVPASMPIGRSTLPPTRPPPLDTTRGAAYTVGIGNQHTNTPTHQHTNTLGGHAMMMEFTGTDWDSSEDEDIYLMGREDGGSMYE